MTEDEPSIRDALGKLRRQLTVGGALGSALEHDTDVEIIRASHPQGDDIDEERDPTPERVSFGFSRGYAR